ncbi:Arm DNA-binding domain-containing protein [uncultured Chryseobacterium sp.]|nr:Arm DNA-binding domain-containing protein [uncultured Chryseobacterium sp.]
MKKNKIRANGTTPIYLRITLDGKAAEIAAKRYVDPQNSHYKIFLITFFL